MLRAAIQIGSKLRQRYLVIANESSQPFIRAASSSSGRPSQRGRGGGGGGGGGVTNRGGRGGGGGGGGGATASSGYNNKSNSGNVSSSSSSSHKSSSVNNDQHHHSAGSSAYSKTSQPELQIVANEDIARKVGGFEALVRVIVAEDKTNLGVISVSDAISVSKSRGLDVVMIATPPGSPPVCRLIGLAAYRAERLEAAEKERERELEAKRAQEALALETRKQKEIRLTTRTDDHDLGVKCARIVEFLRSGHSVRVAVSFSKSTSAWVKEEPHRRAMFAAVVRAVMTSGSGSIDPNSIQGSGANLVGVFSANKIVSTSTTSTSSTSSAPRGSSDWDKVLNRLADPRGLRPDEGEVPSFVKTAMIPSSSSASDLQSPNATTTSMPTQPPIPPSPSTSTSPAPSSSKNHPSLPPDLPPVEMLIRSARRISPRSSTASSTSSSSAAAAPTPPADDEDRGISASGMGDVRFKIGGGKAGGGSGSSSGIVSKGRRSSLGSGHSSRGGSSSGGGGGRSKR